MNYKENLKEYIEMDPMYQDWKSNKLFNLSDFEEFSISHCKDIECLLNEVEELEAMIDKEDGCNHRRRQIFELKDKLCVALKDIKNLKQENEVLKRNCNIGNENLSFYIQQNKELKEELQKADSITQSCIFNGKKESELNFRQSLNLVKELRKENQQLHNKIDKAIRYIKKNKHYIDIEDMNMYLYEDDINKVLEILKYGDVDE